MAAAPALHQRQRVKCIVCLWLVYSLLFLGLTVCDRGGGGGETIIAQLIGGYIGIRRGQVLEYNTRFKNEAYTDYF
ncbi:hypothetical protein OUZ56_014418 [Daphnia magna]|uniref:Uncharacterized protein n=1 Tax=Daphnia magna TaxID=35525 RepID=A0ABR0AJW4_9CRUS|nr:hypothetical protein OUZ56_014418 [Daphnia magna]